MSDEKETWVVFQPKGPYECSDTEFGAWADAYAMDAFAVDGYYNYHDEMLNADVVAFKDKKIAEGWTCKRVFTAEYIAAGIMKSMEFADGELGEPITEKIQYGAPCNKWDSLLKK